MVEQVHVINASKAERMINLTELPADKKRLIWRLIQAKNHHLATLLTSDHFTDFKQKLEQRFGPVAISIDPRDVGGDENGISRLS